MAKKRGRRKRSRKGFVAIPFNVVLSLGTIGDLTVQKLALLGGNLLEDLFIYSVDAVMTLRGHTAGEGPISVGIAHTDYSVGEIAEALDVGALLGPQLKIERERAGRLVRKWGLFRGLQTNEIIAKSDGRYQRYKVRWTQQDGADVNCWVQNQSGSALTTGTVLEIEGVLYGRWLV